MASSGAIIYYRKPEQKFQLEICAVGFVGLGLWLLLSDVMGHSEITQRSAGIVSLLCFGLCALVIGRKAMTKHPIFSVNHDGFTLGKPGEKEALEVDWSEVQGVGVANIADDKVLSFAFRDPESLKARMTASQRLKANENESAGVPILMIPQKMLDTSVDDIRNVSTKFFFNAG